jgi:tRNA-splicing endonuclease subunit Sen2
LGCLKIFKDEESLELNCTDLWRILSKLDKNFILKYIVYHKLRAKGWILKNGIKYGCDFRELNKEKPFFHKILIPFYLK